MIDVEGQGEAKGREWVKVKTSAHDEVIGCEMCGGTGKIAISLAPGNLNRRYALCVGNCEKSTMLG